MPVLYQIHDSDDDKILKDKLRKIFDHVTKRLDAADKTTEIVDRVVTTSESGGGSSSLANHASTHEDGGADEIDHDSLEGFVALEHYPAIDEDDMASDSDTEVPTQQSVKAYVNSAVIPGGNDTEIQFNDGGVFGADADLTWDKTNNRLGIGEASPDVSLEITDNAPYLSLHNSTKENDAGGRESRIYFKGEKFGGSEHTLAYVEVSHNTANDDTKGGFLLYLNDGSSAKQRLYILDDGEIRFSGELIINYNGSGGTSGSALEVNHQTMPYIWITNLNPEDSDEGRETRIFFRGVGTSLQYDDTLAMIEGNHDGSAGNQRGNLLFCTNAGSDNDSPTEAMRIDSNQDITMEKNLTIKQGINIVCNNNEVICHNNEVVFA
jgi:hypothetical protein